MLFIGNFYYVSNQEEALDANRRHGEFNLMIEADSAEVALDTFRSRILALRELRDFFTGEGYNKTVLSSELYCTTIIL